MLKVSKNKRRRPMISGSKEGQDKLVLHLIKGPGFFLDVGCGQPEHTNNTFRLEKMGWKGLLFDRDPGYIAQCRRQRTSQPMCLDCGSFTTEEWLHLLNENKVPKVIDYMSVDVDDANTGFIRNFPFGEYTFKVMTFETDLYQCGNSRKRAAVEVLSRFPSYAMILEDAMLEPGGRIWEDWWVNEKYISKKDLYSKSIYWNELISMLD